jgi:hypothetical protein
VEALERARRSGPLRERELAGEEGRHSAHSRAGV